MGRRWKLGGWKWKRLVRCGNREAGIREKLPGGAERVVEVERE